MIDGMLMDTPGHEIFQDRYETWEELYLYCYRVAGTVGLMVLPIMGCSEDSTLEEALEPALALGVALQLTNILRDVGEDRARRRIYLPQEDLERFGVSEAALLARALLKSIAVSVDEASVDDDAAPVVSSNRLRP